MTAAGDTVTTDYLIGSTDTSKGTNFIITVNGDTESADYDYTVEGDTYDEYEALMADDSSYTTDITTNLFLDTADAVQAYVETLYDAFAAEQTTYTTVATNIDLSSFDYIFIEAGAYGTDGVLTSENEIGYEVYNTLCTLVANDKVYVIASSGAASVQSSSDGSSVSTSGGLIVSSASAKAIADIINAGNYRDGADNKYRVLEIQPDYPIDVELAEQSSGGSSYTKHSDGTSFTGNYYTTPSDVVSGSAKEELEGTSTEYYDFDLTKAKIAYAIDGVSYSDIELTQVSTEALIGMTEDIASTYDLVYIGGDISAMDVSQDEFYKENPLGNDAASKVLGYTLPIFIMYAHTGKLLQITQYSDQPWSGKNYQIMAAALINGEVYMPENGNDLTSTKYEELKNYIAAGLPILVSNELTSVYEQMTGYNLSCDYTELTEAKLLQGYWFVAQDGGSSYTLTRGNIYLDPSSWIYKLLGILYADKDDDNVVWGFDPTDTQMIDNTAGTYGNTLYTYCKSDGKSYVDAEVQNETWYKNADTQDTAIKQYAVVFNEESGSSGDLLNEVVNGGSTSRVRLTVSDMPTTYVQGIKSTYVYDTDLNFTFTVSGGKKSKYSYNIYVDIDKNTVFDSTDIVASSSEIAVNSSVSPTVSLDPDFMGAAYWKIEILDGTTVVAYKTGLCKIVQDTDDKAEINVLQIQTNEPNTEHEIVDTLFFDIESQHANQLLYYNASTDSVNGLGNCTFTQQEYLGRHLNRFGICKYDDTEDADDWYSNWADELLEDYDINLDIVIAEESNKTFSYTASTSSSSPTYETIEKWAAQANELKTKGKYNGYTQDEYAELAETALQTYSSKQATREAAQKKVKAYLQNIIDEYLEGTGTVTQSGFFANARITNKATLKNFYEALIESGEYYQMFWSYYSNSTALTAYGDDFYTLFVAYRDALNDELDAKDTYDYYRRLSYGEEFLENMYSIIVIGASDYFGNFSTDLSEYACQYIVNFIDAGGDLFFFSNTMTPFSNAGSVNLTTALLDVVGMNRFHVDLTNQASSYDEVTVSSVSGYSSATPAGVFDASVSAGETYYARVPNISASSTGIEYGYLHDWTTVTSSNVDNIDYVYTTWAADGFEAYTPSVTAYDQNRQAYTTLYRKEAEIGDQGYLFDVAVSMTYIDNNYNTYYYYFYEAVATSAMSGVYVYQDAMDGHATYSGTQTGLEYNAENVDCDPTIYYLTPYANNTSLGVLQTAGVGASMLANLCSSSVITSSNYSQTTSVKSWTVSALSMSTLFYAMNKSTGAQSYLKYIYAQMDVNGALRHTTNDGKHHDTNEFAQTNKASQLNEGLITMYPFSIGDSLNITGTHQQAYSLDLENTNITVWYTLAGSNNTTKSMSSMFAASPYDAMESYFIYTSAYGSGAITYCGCGHMEVTGAQTKNNDERKLFINVIVNSAAAVKSKPKVTLYDPTTEEKLTETLTVDSDIANSTGQTVYKITVDSKTDYPTFDIGTVIPSGVSVTSIRVYYDLDYDEDFGSSRPSCTTSAEDGEDVIIYNQSLSGMTAEQIAAVTGVFSYTSTTKNSTLGISINSSTAQNLQLQESYFANYGGKYTYLVVEVYYDGSTTPVYAIIKIYASDPLFELTQATYSLSTVTEDAKEN